MKKLFFIFLSLFLCLNFTNAQQRSWQASAIGTHKYTPVQQTEAFDTLHYIVPPSVLYTATIGGNPGGYVNGTNGYGDLGKYQRLDFPYSNVMGHGMFFYFGAKEVIGTPDTIHFVIRRVSATGAPGDLVASFPKLTTDLDTSGAPTVISFAKGNMDTDSSFFIGFEWGTTVDDKFGLLSNQSPNGANPSRVWEKWSDGTFVQYGTPSSWTLQIDLWAGMIYAQQLAGDYYIPQGVNPQGFATLNDAVAALNSNGAAADVNFILDADTVRAASMIFDNPFYNSSKVTVKPAAGRNTVLMVSSAASVGNGPYMIGFRRGNVTFDGSNNGTDSRNLIVTTEQIAPVVDLPFTLNHADADNVTLKNLEIKNIITGQTNFRYGAVINDLGGVTNFRVENCQIGTPERPVRRDALAPWGAAASGGNQFSFVNNVMYAGTRGVATIYLLNSEIIGNEINILPTTAAATDAYNHGIYITGNTGSLNIEGNTINCLEKTVNASSYLIGLAFAGNSFDSTDVIRIVNNFINVGAANETRFTYGIGLRSAGNMGNMKIYHNTVIVNNNASTLQSHAIGNHTNGTGPVNIDLKNNIVINNHSGSTVSSALGLVPATSVLTSDYNVLQANQNLVNFQGTTYATLPLWQATGKDVNSVSKAVNFVSGTDLHLTGSSNGDADLGAPPVGDITVDIDGDDRNEVMTYKGADEASIPLFTQSFGVPFTENFEYGPNNDTSLVTITTNWVRHSGSMGPAYSASSLSFPGYPSSGVGGSVAFTNGGSAVNDGDINRAFDSVATAGNVYTSFLVNLTSARATADYFFHIGPKTLGTTFRARVYAKSSGAGFVMGLSKTGSPIVEDPTVLNFNQTYLIIVKYNLNLDAANDDLVTMYVYDTATPGTEPGTPLLTVGPVGAGVADGLNSIGSIAIRQGTNTPTGTIDGIRVSTTWDYLVPVELTSFTGNVSGNSVQLGWTTATETNNSGFSVERKSADGSWSAVAFIQGKGTTTSPESYSYTDRNLNAGVYTYRLKQIDYDGTFSYSGEVEADVTVPAEFTLSQNYPNPFNPSTTINFTLPVQSHVRLAIYAVTGELVELLVNEVRDAGSYNAVFDASKLSSGVYIYRMTAGNVTLTKKMNLLK
ncbi:MAG: T9SS type A sorting domain-containing protein [Ignavibacteriales bacterium]|nr:MAG: T9SS type A sorting domain-containing protein [Ignavibacteriales bacterium]